MRPKPSRDEPFKFTTEPLTLSTPSCDARSSCVSVHGVRAALVITARSSTARATFALVSGAFSRAAVAVGVERRRTTSNRPPHGPPGPLAGIFNNRSTRTRLSRSTCKNAKSQAFAPAGEGRSPRPPRPGRRRGSVDAAEGQSADRDADRKGRIPALEDDSVQARPPGLRRHVPLEVRPDMSDHVRRAARAR